MYFAGSWWSSTLRAYLPHKLALKTVYAYDRISGDPGQTWNGWRAGPSKLSLARL
jgi:hypothetical protein